MSIGYMKKNKNNSWHKYNIMYNKDMKKMDNEEFRKIRKSLKNKKTGAPYSQGDFGKLLGFPRPQIQISRIEKGVVSITPRLERLVRMIAKYGPDYLIKRFSISPYSPD